MFVFARFPQEDQNSFATKNTAGMRIAMTGRERERGRKGKEIMERERKESGREEKDRKRKDGKRKDGKRKDRKGKEGKRNNGKRGKG